MGLFLVLCVWRGQVTTGPGKIWLQGPPASVPWPVGTISVSVGLPASGLELLPNGFNEGTF